MGPISLCRCFRVPDIAIHHRTKPPECLEVARKSRKKFIPRSHSGIKDWNEGCTSNLGKQIKAKLALTC
jgi:hypothetical protein